MTQACPSLPSLPFTLTAAMWLNMATCSECNSVYVCVCVRAPKHSSCLRDKAQPHSSLYGCVRLLSGFVLICLSKAVTLRLFDIVTTSASELSRNYLSPFKLQISKKDNHKRITKSHFILIICTKYFNPLANENIAIAFT